MARATWIWVHEGRPLDLAGLVEHAVAEGVDDAFVSVPWTGPDARVRACATALRQRGVRVAALGGDPAWASDDAASAWARRAVAEGLVDAVHLDVEPWTRTDWPGAEAALLDGLARAARAVADVTGLPVEVDLVPWLAAEHPAGFAAVAAAADAVTLMAYRDRAADVLAASAAAREALAAIGVPWRIAVDTMPDRPPRETFADDGRAVLAREAAVLERALTTAAGFAGLAIHDLEHWRALR